MRRVSVGGAAVLLWASLVVGANAAHPTQICIDAEPDRTTAFSNDEDAETLEVGVGATDSDHEEPHQEGCVIRGGPATQVDFEITGASDPDSSDSPETPDMTCTTREGTAFCQVIPPSSSGGEQTIAAWIDFDQDDSTVELDRDEEADDTDTDATDVAAWIWTHKDYFLWSSIKYDRERERFVGKVNANPPCVMDRDVTVKKKVGDRKVSVGSDVSNERGRWIVPLAGARGRFFAVAKPKPAEGDSARCARLRSPTIRVR